MQEYGIIVLAIIISIIFLNFWNDCRAMLASRSAKKASRPDHQAQQNLAVTELPTTSTAENQIMETKGTRDLLLQTLTAIGCQYEIGKGEDDRIHFAFQGEHFLVAADNERPYINVFDYTWGSVELFDIDELSRLRKAINEANWRCSVQTVFSIDETAKSMDVHCKSNFLFIPQIPKLEDYLRVELNEFFRAHQLVGAEMERLRNAEGQLNKDSHKEA